jgi:hypothetical protein
MKQRLPPSSPFFVVLVDNTHARTHARTHLLPSVEPLINPRGVVFPPRVPRRREASFDGSGEGVPKLARVDGYRRVRAKANDADDWGLLLMLVVYGGGSVWCWPPPNPSPPH